MHIVHSGCSIDESSVIHQLMEIEKDVFTEEYRGEYNQIKARFEKFPEMFFLVIDDESANNKIVGYLCYFPIKDELYHEIVYNNEFHDDDISPDCIGDIDNTYNIYLLSIALKKSYQNRGIADMMMVSFEDEIIKCSKENNHPFNIITSVVTQDGDAFVKKCGYVFMFESKMAGFKLYTKEVI